MDAACSSCPQSPNPSSSPLAACPLTLILTHTLHTILLFAIAQLHVFPKSVQPVYWKALISEQSGRIAPRGVDGIPLTRYSLLPQGLN
jgi:hypothetical protein